MVHWSKTLNRKKVIKKLSETRKRRIANGDFQVWNKGKKGVQVAWNKGLTKKDSRVKKNVERMLKTRKERDNYKHTKQAKENIRKGVKLIIQQGKGNPFKPKEKNISWNNGSSFGKYGVKFNKKLKLRIRKRDSFTCQECNQTEKQLGYKLSVHHIDYDKKNNNPDNLISLCKSCHSQTNFSRNNWISYFQEKLR